MTTIDELRLSSVPTHYWNYELKAVLAFIEPILSVRRRYLHYVSLVNEVILIEVACKIHAGNPERLVTGTIDGREDLHVSANEAFNYF